MLLSPIINHCHCQSKQKERNFSSLRLFFSRRKSFTSKLNRILNKQLYPSRQLIKRDMFSTCVLTYQSRRRRRKLRLNLIKDFSSFSLSRRRIINSLMKCFQTLFDIDDIVHHRNRLMHRSTDTVN